MSDMGVVVGVSGYLIMFLVMLPMAGFGNLEFVKPGEGVVSFGGNETQEVQEQGVLAAVVECVVTSLIAGPASGFAIILDLTFDIPVVDCSRSETTIFHPAIVDAVSFAFEFAFSIIQYFFQLLLFQIDGVHPLILLVFFHMPGALLAIVGLRMVRGVG